MGTLFAARYPERCARWRCAGGSPARSAPACADLEALARGGGVLRLRGDGASRAPRRGCSPALAGRPSDPRRQGWSMRAAGGRGPGRRSGVDASYADIDVRDVLPAVRVPTLVLHAGDDRIVPVEAGRSIAVAIPGARLVELPGDEHIPWLGHRRPAARRDRVVCHRKRMRRSASGPVLATVLFTDIVGSTAQRGRARRPPLARAARSTTTARARRARSATADARSRRWATASWPRSTARRTRSAALRDARPAPTRASRSAPGCTPASASRRRRRRRASPCTSARA